MQGFSKEWLEEYEARRVKPTKPRKSAPKAELVTVRHKFGAKEVTEDDIRFDSQLERDYYRYLVAERAAGRVVFFLRQVPFHLPGRTRYQVDFAVFWASGHVEFVDTKGVETEAFRIKLRQTEELYPVKIKIVKRGDF